MLSVWGEARRRSCCRTADVLPCCTHLYAVTFSCWLYIVFCLTGATHNWITGCKNASCGSWPHDVLWGKAFLFFNSSRVTAGQTVSCCVVAPLGGSLIVLLLRQDRQCPAVWWRLRVAHWLFYYVVSAHCLADMSPCRCAHLLVVEFRFFTDFSSTVVATSLLVTLVSNENRYSENHIFLSGVNYILPRFSTRIVRSV
jgi:hypothetical protein